MQTCSTSRHILLIFSSENTFHHNFPRFTVFHSIVFRKYSCDCNVIFHLFKITENQIDAAVAAAFISFIILQLPMLANYKNLTKEKLYDVLEIFVSSVLTGGATVYIAFLMICIFS